MAARIILAAQTGAGNSSAFEIRDRNKGTVMCELGATETADIEITPDDGTTWLATGVSLSDTEQAKTIYGPGQFRVAKGATASAVAVYVAAGKDM